MVLDAYEAALGPTGPNPLHHRIDHAIRVTDDQLARMAAMDLVTVIHLDGAAATGSCGRTTWGTAAPTSWRRDRLAHPLA